MSHRSDHCPSIRVIFQIQLEEPVCVPLQCLALQMQYIMFWPYYFCYLCIHFDLQIGSWDYRRLLQIISLVGTVACRSLD